MSDSLKNESVVLGYSFFPLFLNKNALKSKYECNLRKKQGYKDRRTEEEESKKREDLFEMEKGSWEE
jgi:hypothetical protein